MAQQLRDDITRAYAFALSLQPALKRRAEATLDRLAAVGGDLHWRALADIAARHRMLVVTMTLAQCVRLLNEGAWLNVYEAAMRPKDRTESITLAMGTVHQHRALPGDWMSRRVAIEHILHFEPDAHYASLAFGGAPESRYGGECCVVLDLEYWEPQATCFAGDTLRACFDASGCQLPDDRVLESFAIAGDWRDLLLLRHEGYLRSLCDEPPGIDPQQIRAVLEDPDTMLEMHLHGPVTVDQVQKVLISRAFRDRCRAKINQWEIQGRQNTHDLEAAPLFLHLLEQLKTHSIWLELAEGK